MWVRVMDSDELLVWAKRVAGCDGDGCPDQFDEDRRHLCNLQALEWFGERCADLAQQELLLAAPVLQKMLCSAQVAVANEIMTRFAHEGCLPKIVDDVIKRSQQKQGIG